VPGILGNIPASGTEIIKVLGEEHVKTQSRSSTRLLIRFSDCRARRSDSARSTLRDLRDRARHTRRRAQVGRVIARPFLGQPGAFYRTENRHDYAVPPPRENLLPALADEGLDVVCIGKIASIYDSLE
jgi:phosphopentomutase